MKRFFLTLLCVSIVLLSFVFSQSFSGGETTSATISDTEETVEQETSRDFLETTQTILENINTISGSYEEHISEKETMFTGIINVTHSDKISFEEETTTGTIILNPQESSNQSVQATETNSSNSQITETVQSDLSPLLITEVSPKDTDLFGEYIIIKAQEDYIGVVSVYGIGQGSYTKDIDISLLAGEQLLITDKLGQIGQPHYLLDSITLTDGGEELQLVDDQGVVLDRIVYSSAGLYEALFYQETIDDIREFSLMGTQTAHISVIDEIGSCSIQTIQSDVIFQTGNAMIILQATGFDEKFCSPPYHVERSSETMSFGPSGCTQSLAMTTGAHTVNLEVYLQNEVLCEASVSLFQYTTNLCEEEHIQNEVLAYTGLLINEIHPYDTDYFPEYMELKAVRRYNGSVSVAGLGHGGATKEFDVDVVTGDLVVIADGATGFVVGTKLIVLPSISLTDAGEQLIVYGHSGHVMDTVDYSGSIKGKSLYEDTFSSGVRLFNEKDAPTPGIYLQQILHLFDSEDASIGLTCGIKLQHNTPIHSTNKINLIAQVDNKDIQNSSSTYHCNWLFPGSTYQFSEGCNPGFYDYATGGVYRVELEITNNENSFLCATHLDINLPAPGSSGGGSDYYEELYQKRKGRFETLKKEVTNLGYGVTTTGIIYEKGSSTTSLSTQAGLLEIVAALPNPGGNDTDREQLIIKNKQTIPVSLSGYYIFNGTSKKKIKTKATIGPMSTGFVQASLGLTNKPTCITLQSTEFVYDSFCYPKANDDEWFYESLDQLEQAGDTGSLFDATIQLTDTQACIVYNKQQLLCKNLPYTTTETKERKAQARKLESNQKKLIKEQERVLLRREKYAGSQEKRKKEENTLRAARKERDRYKQQNSLSRSFVFMILDDLYKHRGAVYEASGMTQKKYLYSSLYAALETQTQKIDVMGMSFGANQLGSLISFYSTQKIPLHEVELDTTYNDLIEQTKDLIDVLKHNLTVAPTQGTQLSLVY